MPRFLALVQAKGEAVWKPTEAPVAGEIGIVTDTKVVSGSVHLAQVSPSRAGLDRERFFPLGMASSSLLAAACGSHGLPQVKATALAGLRRRAQPAIRLVNPSAYSKMATRISEHRLERALAVCYSSLMIHE